MEYSLEKFKELFQSEMNSDCEEVGLKLVPCSQCSTLQFHGLKDCPYCPGTFTGSFAGWKWKHIIEAIARNKSQMKGHDLLIVLWCHCSVAFIRKHFGYNTLDEFEKAVGDDSHKAWKHCKEYAQILVPKEMPERILALLNKAMKNVWIDKKVQEVFLGYGIKSEIDYDCFLNAAGNHFYDDQCALLGISEIEGHRIREFFQVAKHGEFKKEINKLIEENVDKN